MPRPGVLVRITPAMLQGMFLDFARELCVEELESVKNCPSYEGRPEDLYEGYRCWFDALSDWTQNIEAGNLLRVLRFVGAYDGRKIDRVCLLTALRTLCYVARFADSLEGDVFSFEECRYEIPYDSVCRLDRFVRATG